MSTDAGQQSVERRNLIFTVGGLTVVMIFLTAFIERDSIKLKSNLHVPPPKPKKHVELTTTPVIPKTTVNIQPLVTRFPALPNFKNYEQTEKRKAAFFDYLTPIIEYQNEKILRDRNRLEHLSKLIVNGEPLSDKDTEWLYRLAEKYEVDWKDNDPGSVAIKLARRVDIIPKSLALVQAAKESSWGRSRYAVQANNLFGQWCYDQGCGVIPANRTPGAVHEVRRYKSVNDATRSYLHNLNTHPQYALLRQIRQQLRMQHKPITGESLAEGLLYYSERREEYVNEVKQMIQQYSYFQGRRTG